MAAQTLVDAVDFVVVLVETVSSVLTEEDDEVEVDYVVSVAVEASAHVPWQPSPPDRQSGLRSYAAQLCQHHQRTRSQCKHIHERTPDGCDPTAFQPT